MFEPSVLANDPAVRRPLVQVLEAAVRAVDPAAATAAAVAASSDGFRTGDHEFALPPGRVIVLGLGKAAVAMARGLAGALPGVALTGVVASPDPAPGPEGIEVIRGSHPVPDDASLEAGAALMRSATAAGPDDLVVVLVSGGGSACAEVPAAGLGIGHLADATRVLLASGAPIEEINVVRRALSDLKGGGLARAAAPAPIVTLVMSDVVGNHLPTIAGGPTVPSPDRPGAAAAVAARHGLTDSLPRPVAARLADGAAPGAVDAGPVVIVGDGAVAARGAASAAAALGIPATVVDTGLVGEAADVGRLLARAGRSAAGPGMEIYAGETTVTVRGSGWGGRNQEVALAAGIALEGTDGMVVAACGTDGIDGPTDAAGGIGDGGTVARGRAAGRHAAASLAANDSGTYLRATGDRLVSGPTGTNVGDVMVVYRPG